MAVGKTVLGMQSRGTWEAEVWRERQALTNMAASNRGTLSYHPTPLARTKQKSVCRGLGATKVSQSLGAAWMGENESGNSRQAVARSLRKPAWLLEWPSPGRNSALIFMEVRGYHTGGPTPPSPFILLLF